MDNQQLLAILVDRYLRENNFSKTRTTFKNEASFIFNSPIFIDHDHQLLVHALSLDKILDELICLNYEKKMILNERDRTQKLLQSMEFVMHSYYESVSKTLPTGVKVDHQERLLMEQEKLQINLLIFRMQSLINDYAIECLQTTNTLMSPPLPNANSVMVPTGTTTLPETRLPKLPLAPLCPKENSAVLPTGVTAITTTSAGSVVPQSINPNPRDGNLPTGVTTQSARPVMSVSNRKRKEIEATDATSIGKKSRGRPPKIPVQGKNTLSQSNNVVNKQTVSHPCSETQSIARNVVPVPKSSTRTTSFQSDADISHTEFLRVPPCNGEATPTSIESIPITNILVPLPLSNAKSSVVPQPEHGNETPTGQKTLPQSKQIVSQPSSATQSLAGNIVPNGPQIQGSSVVISSPVPKKPTGATSCHNDADLSDIEFYRVPTCSGEATPNLTNKVIVSPPEQMDYTKSSNCISSDMLDSLDIPELANLTFDDDLGAKFWSFDDDEMGIEFTLNDDDLKIFDDILNDDQDLPCKGVNFSDHPTSDQSKDNGSRFSHECEGEQVISELLPSTAAKVLSEKDMNIQGPNSLTAMGSFKKCTTNLSSRRNCHHGFDKENF